MGRPSAQKPRHKIQPNGGGEPSTGSLSDRSPVVIADHNPSSITGCIPHKPQSTTLIGCPGLPRSWPAAGKTGTTNQGRTLWFMGYTPSYTAGVMVGNDDRRPIRKGTGGRFAAPIWLDFMSRFLRGRATHDFGPWAKTSPPTASQLGKPTTTLPPGVSTHPWR